MMVFKTRLKVDRTRDDQWHDREHKLCEANRECFLINNNPNNKCLYLWSVQFIEMKKKYYISTIYKNRNVKKIPVKQGHYLLTLWTDMEEQWSMQKTFLLYFLWKWVYRFVGISLEDPPMSLFWYNGWWNNYENKIYTQTVSYKFIKMLCF